MGEKNEGLGLGLSLSFECPENHLPPPPLKAPFPLNLLSYPPFPYIHRHHLQNHVQNHQQLSSLLNHPPPPDLNAERGNRKRGIDVNKTPSTSTSAAAECEEEAVVSSPNSTVSSLSGKRAENESERESSLHGMTAEEEEEEEEEENDEDAAAVRKKLRLSKDQAVVLEATFKEHNSLNPNQKVALANQLDLRPRQVEVWFQNRRARTKSKQTEVDCEYLKHSCKTLTDENKRLQKEVNELRALKLSPQFYMNTNPPTTLTMCPQCERVARHASVGTSSSSLATNSLVKALHHSLMGSGQPKQSNPLLPRATVGTQQQLHVRHT